MQAKSSEKRPRARDLGILFEGMPGPFNAITDVPGVAVGYTTLLSGDVRPGGAPPAVRTGVTAILPRMLKGPADPVFAGYFSLNGSGEMTGMHLVDETGLLEGPVMITNSNSVGLVRDAVVKWQIKNGKMFQPFSLPFVAETSDTYLSDPNGFHISDNDVFTALDSAHSGQIAEGNIGGGTGMCVFEWKGRTGTSSRKLTLAGGYTVGVLVQANFGFRFHATIAGMLVGKLIAEGPKVFSQNSLYN